MKIDRKKIRQIRKSKESSLNQLSQKSGIDRTYLSKIESGKIKNPYFSTIAKIAEGLSVPISDLCQLGSECIDLKKKSTAQEERFMCEIVDIIHELKSAYESSPQKFNQLKKIIELILKI